MSGERFELRSEFEPKGDQPAAIAELVRGIREGEPHQTLLGVTGSGKSFTMACVVAELNRPTLVMAPNKTLAAQLYSEFKGLFPGNAVEYFVSYYDYYQPEAYLPASDTYIEKDASINDEIDKLRHSTTHSLLTRRDVLVVASVSCIYGLGAPATYGSMHAYLETGAMLPRDGSAAPARGHALRTKRRGLPPRHLSGARRRGRDLSRIRERESAANRVLRRRDRVHRRNRSAAREGRWARPKRSDLSRQSLRGHRAAS